MTLLGNDTWVDLIILNMVDFDVFLDIAFLYIMLSYIFMLK